MKQLILTLLAATGCLLLSPNAYASLDLCDAVPSACDTPTSPPPLFEAEVCYKNNAALVELTGSLCARGYTQYNCFLGSSGSTGVTCYEVPADEMISLPSYDYAMPSTGECYYHEASSGDACAEKSDDQWCCDEADGEDAEDCELKVAGVSCDPVTPNLLDVCTSPNGSTASIPGGMQPDENGNCPDGTVKAKYGVSGNASICLPDIQAPGGDGDGDGDGGGGCPPPSP